MVGSAREWFCDPVNGDTKNGDGSKDKPFGTLQSVFKAQFVNGADRKKGRIHAGDAIRLFPGNHGKVSFQGDAYKNEDYIVVTGVDGLEPPTLNQLTTKFAEKWMFAGIQFLAPDDMTGRYMLCRAQDVQEFRVERCSFESVTEYPFNWTDDDWSAKCAQYGLWASGDFVYVNHNDFSVLENCIYLQGRFIECDNNNCELFLNDGIEFAASDIRIRHNRIVDQYNVAANLYHHDGIQGWTVDGLTNTAVSIEDNYVARSSGEYRTIEPLSSAVFQGISIFDGKNKGVTVKNNVVMASASHGIAMYGVADCTIENNTVIYQGVTPNKPCWIGSFTGKPKWGAIVPTNNIIRNNIAPTYALASVNSTTPEPGITLENNFSFKAPNKPYQKACTVVRPEDTFVKYKPDTAEFDLHIQDTSPAAGKIIRVAGAGAEV